MKRFPALGGILLVSLACALLDAAAGGGLEPAQGALGFGDRRFFEDAVANEERAEALVSERDFDGLLLDAPRRVRSLEGGLPLVGARASSIRDNRLVSLRRRGLVVAIDPETDTVLAETVFRLDEDPPRPPSPDEEFPKGRTVKAFQFRLDERIDGLPGGARSLHALLLLFDRRSNVVAVEIERGGKAEGTSAVHAAAKLAADAYRKRPDSPALTGGAGIALAAAQGSSAPLRGSFELPLRDADSAGTLPDSALAVVPVTLLLTGEQDARPILVPLRVPVYERGAGVTGRGYFSLDLNAAVGDALRPQSYAVWAFSRLAVSNPVLLGSGAGG